MGFSSKLKAHKDILTLETLRFLVEFLEDGNARLAALRSGIPETYAGRYGAWLKKHPAVKKALEQDLEVHDVRALKKALSGIERHIEDCKKILGLEEF